MGIKLNEILTADYFRDIDTVFANFIRESGGDDIITLSAALVSHALVRGDICIDLEKLSNTVYGQDEERELAGFKLYDFEIWKNALEESKIIGSSSENKMLILDGHRLYMHRYFNYQKECAKAISRLIRDKSKITISSQTITLAKKLFISNFANSDSGDFLQIAAGILPFFTNFSVISGGPGTGKTTVLAKLLALQISENSNMNIALAAPTGKAAMRMNESIQSAIKSLDLPLGISDKLADLKAVTIHRLLGYRHNSPYFKHNDKTPLLADMIVIDESSMVDLAMMSKVLNAIKSGGRLILLGDMYQLASVEAGGVLGDICEAFGSNIFNREFSEYIKTLSGDSFNFIESENILSPVVLLKKSYRFDKNSGIGKVSRSINQDNIQEALKVLDNSTDCHFNETPNSYDTVITSIYNSYKSLLKSKTVEDSLAYLSNYKVLCAVRNGRFGVNGINRAILSLITNSYESQLFENMPIMIQQNSYLLKLFNGDTGIIKKDNSGIFRAWFAGEQKGEIRSFIPAQLPQFDTAFAMTVHKSQGSEFDEIMFLIPEFRFQLLTRELIYTGVTRAKKKVTVIGNRENLEQSLRNRVVRVSGLCEAIQSLNVFSCKK